MPTAIVKSIGTASRNYPTPALFAAAIPVNITAAGTDETWTGECYNDSEFTSAVSFSGTTTDATHWIKLTTAAGHSFKDNINKLTNALKYNQANGVGIKITAGYTIAIDLAENYVTIDGIQIYRADAAGVGQCVRAASGSNQVVQNCLLHQADNNAYAYDDAAVGSAKLINTLIISTSTTKEAARGSGASSFYNCTIVRPSDVVVAYAGIVSSTNTIIKNCAVFGFNAVISGSANAASGYNATDNASAPGSNNQVSKTYANQFTGITTTALDFRVKSGSDVANNGTRDAANTNDLDIVGQSRSTTTPTIGAWEFISAGITATISSTLDNITSAISIVPRVAVSISSILSDFTSAISISPSVKVDIYTVLDTITSAINITIGVITSVSIASTLGNATSSISITPSVRANIASTLDNITSAISVTVSAVASVSSTLSNFTSLILISTTSYLKSSWATMNRRRRR